MTQAERLRQAAEARLELAIDRMRGQREDYNDVRLVAEAYLAEHAADDTEHA